MLITYLITLLIVKLINCIFVPILIKTKTMTITKNGFNFRVVQQTQHYNGTTWTNKKVVEITPTEQTCFDLQDNGGLENYPEYHTRDVDETLEEIVYDITTI